MVLLVAVQGASHDLSWRYNVKLAHLHLLSHVPSSASIRNAAFVQDSGQDLL